MTKHDPPLNRAIFMATHNSYAGGPRRSVHDQLDAGVRCLEFDVTHDSRRLAVGHGWTGYQVSRIGDNPITNRLRDWLALVGRWADDPDHAGHEPLIIVLDIKHKLASRGDFVSISVLGRMCRDVFGDRIVAPDTIGPAWPRAGELRDKVLLVLSGERKSRQRGLRDMGREPAVAANGVGDVVEVHRSHNGAALWYWAGAMRDGWPRWTWHDRYGRGITPAVALNDQGIVVAVSRAVGSDNVWYRLGRFGAHGRIKWGRARSLARGRAPAVRFTSPGGRSVAVSYTSPGGERLERRGGLKVAEDRIGWRDAVASPATDLTTRAALPGGNELRVRSVYQRLQWSSGGGDWHDLTYAPLIFVEQQPGDDAWMATHDPRFAAALAGRDSWLDDRLAEGRIVRAWKFGRKHTGGPRVSLPATETPYAEWYRSYVESNVGG